MRLSQIREVLPIFGQKLRVRTPQNRPYLKEKIRHISKAKFTEDVKMLYEKVCQVSRRYRCTFFSYREYYVCVWGGVFTPPPGQARINVAIHHRTYIATLVIYSYL